LQFSVQELCADFSETLHSSNNPTEYNRAGLSPVGLVAMKILPQMAQDIDPTGFSPRKHHEGCEFKD
jgi:hypothetical protein